DWQGGNYYGTGRAPRAGLAAARAIGMLTYRTDLLFDERFGRRLVTAEVAQAAGAAGWEVQPDPAEWLSGREPLYEVEAYLRHHGEKLNARFDANSYLYLTRAMDVHDIGRGRGGLESALAKLACDVTVIGIDTDYLYAARDLRRTAALARECGVRCRYREIVSKYGHDAFLIEFDQLSRIFADVWAAF
ncbi:MAG: hypothetical protein K6T31_09270, partial [Alicyclobacillus sp.]|nr:hypothetical protein [Alicyclobacillus sp.]